jgi:hypothetical protein
MEENRVTINTTSDERGPFIIMNKSDLVPTSNLIKNIF